MEAPILRPRPATLQVEENSQELIFERKWFTPTHIFLIFFVLFWNGFLVFWYFMASQINGDAKLIFMLFPLIHVSVGIFIIYYTIAGFVNKTTIRADKMELSIRHAPMPWWGNKILEKSDIKQFYTKRVVNSSRNSTSIRFSLMAITKDDVIVKVLTDLTDVDEVKFMEQKIEAFWHITDVKVAGEFDENA